jgi:DeoR/GlpR family transcriptional regulator of sugar metabolism
MMAEDHSQDSSSLAEHRHTLILEDLLEQGSVTIRSLSERLGVSRETIRRDISILAGKNRLKQIRGGAISITQSEPHFHKRQTINAEGKKAIGSLAASMVPDGASVILDSGTTTQAVARALASRNQLKVITNDINICLQLGRINGNEVTLLGGRLQDHEDAVGGWDAVNILSNYFADFAFVGAGAISTEPSLLDFSRDAAELRGRMLDSAKTRVVVADHSKFGRIAPNRVPGFHKITHIITDHRPVDELDKLLAQCPLELIVADESSF